MVGALIGGLLPLVGAVVLYYTLENAKAKRDAQPVFAEMDAAFGRVPLSDGYTVVRSERQGGYYSLFGYQSPGEFRVYAALRGSGVADLKSALESAGFSIGQDYACTLVADRGSVNLYIEFHRYDPAVSLDITGVQCSPTSWPNVYVWVEITVLSPDGYGTFPRRGGQQVPGPRAGRHSDQLRGRRPADGTSGPFRPRLWRSHTEVTTCPSSWMCTST
jgi:hypothetical protein